MDHGDSPGSQLLQVTSRARNRKGFNSGLQKIYANLTSARSSFQRLLKTLDKNTVLLFVKTDEFAFQDPYLPNHEVILGRIMDNLSAT